MSMKCRLMELRKALGTAHIEIIKSALQESGALRLGNIKVIVGSVKTESQVTPRPGDSAQLLQPCKLHCRPLAVAFRRRDR